MKKRVVIGIVLLIVSVFLITTSNANFTVNMNIDGGSESKIIGETVTYKVKLNENIVACNFDINYDNKILEFVGSDTQNLNAAVNGNVVSCIYVDLAQQGTNEFKIKFKVIAESKGQTNIGITNVKFRAKDKETSYVASDIQGVNETLKLTTVAKTNDENTVINDVVNNVVDNTTDNNIDNNILSNNVIGNINNNNKNDIVITKTDKNIIAGSTNDKTTATAKIPQTGLKETTGYFLMICSILIILSGIFKAKENNLKKIFKAGGIMMLALTLVSTFAITSSVYAANSNLEIKFYNNLITNKKSALIIINEKNKKNITKEEVLNLNNNIKEITNSTGTNLNAKDKVKTSDIVKVKDDSYEIILYGDSNCDGIICDTDDIMTIVNDYLGKNKLENAKKIAANLQNSDDILDTDDIMMMMNVYLGKANNIVTSIPTGNIDIGTNNSKDKLADVAQIGDYVNYPVTYKTASGADSIPDQPNDEGWRIFKKEGEKVYLVSNSMCFTVNLSDTEKYGNYEEVCKSVNNEFSKVASSNDTQYGKNAYLDPTYATATRAFNYEDVEKYLGINLKTEENLGKYKTNDLININQVYGLWKHSVYNYTTTTREYILGVNFFDERGIYDMGSIPLGVRTVIELKSSVLTSGKDANGVWQLTK